MAGEILSANMNLPVPGVGVTDGPTYATDVNNCFTLVDAHTHALGSGVQIGPDGLNINAALPMNNFALTSIAALTLTPQTVTPANNSIYESGVDLYFKDGSGNNIRITQSGSVAGSAGTITGLPSGTASASFAAAKFTFQSATNTAATVDVGSVILRNTTASSFGLTLSPPNAMGANYALTLPPLPAQTNIMTLDVSGNMASITYDAAGQNMTSVGANAIAATRVRTITAAGSVLGAVAISGSSGSYVTSSTTYVTPTNLTVTLTTSGRPVMLALQQDGASASSFGNVGGFFRANSGGGACSMQLFRGVTGLGANEIPGDGAIRSAMAYNQIDNIAAGTYVYTCQVKTPSGGTAIVAANMLLVAYEL